MQTHASEGEAVAAEAAARLVKQVVQVLLAPIDGPLDTVLRGGTEGGRVEGGGGEGGRGRREGGEGRRNKYKI